jgi:uncharacterized membrane protein
MKKALYLLLTSLSIVIALYAVIVYGFLELGAVLHPAMKENFKTHPIGIYLHIFPSLIALTIGPFQFSDNIRLNNIHLHRNLGKVYFIAVLIGGIAGLIMSIYSYGGAVSHFGFGILSILWIISGIAAYTTIKKKNIEAHSKWMIINFALTFAAVTLRIGLGIGLASGTAFEVFYPYLSWVCWVPNLIVGLLIIRKDSTKTTH